MHWASSPSLRRTIERRRCAGHWERSGFGSRRDWRDRRDWRVLDPGPRGALPGTGLSANGQRQPARLRSGQAHARGSPERLPRSPCAARVLTGRLVFRRTCLQSDAEIQAGQERWARGTSVLGATGTRVRHRGLSEEIRRPGRRVGLGKSPGKRESGPHRQAAPEIELCIPGSPRTRPRGSS